MSDSVVIFGRDTGIHPKRIEAVGIAIILLAALWEGLVLREVTRLYSEYPFEELTHRLHHIFKAIGSANPRRYYDDNYTNFMLKVSVIDRWGEMRDYLSMGALSAVRTVLFALGSVLVVLAKWKEGTRKPDKI